VNFFGLFSIVFTGLILNRMAASFVWYSSDILIIFAIISVSGLFAFVPLNLADRFGRKPFILIFNGLFLFTIIGSALAPTTTIFIIFRFASGIFGVSVSTVMISEEVPARYRGKAIGIVTGIAMSSSILAAYLFTLTEQSLDMWRYLYTAVCAIGLILISILWLKLRESRRYAYIKEKIRLNNSPFRVWKRKYLKILGLSSLVLFFSNWIYLTIKRYFVIFLEGERASLGFTEELIGTWMIYIYLGSIIGYYLSGYLADSLGRKRTVYLTVFSYFIGSLIFLFSWNLVLIFIGLFILNLTFAVFNTIASFLSYEFFPTEIRSVGAGWVISFATISSVVGNLIMYEIVEALGGWGIMFLIVGTSCLAALIIVMYFIPETRKRVVEEIYFTEIEKLNVEPM